MKVCPKCQVNHCKNGTFCSRKCANSRTWSDVDKQKKSTAIKNSPKFQMVLDNLTLAAEKGRETMKLRGYTKPSLKFGQLLEKQCPICSNNFSSRKKTKKYCSLRCANEGNRIRNNTPEAKARLRDIGRKGGFGKKGYTDGGTYYQSTLEKKCFEHLEKKSILFEAHKPIPNSSKVSDCYLPEKDLWIEIDGIDRDKRQKWLEHEYKYWSNKLDIYKSNNLNFIVVKSFEEFARLA